MRRTVGLMVLIGCAAACGSSGALGGLQISVDYRLAAPDGGCVRVTVMPGDDAGSTDVSLTGRARAGTLQIAAAHRAGWPASVQVAGQLYAARCGEAVPLDTQRVDATFPAGRNVDEVTVTLIDPATDGGAGGGSGGGGGTAGGGTAGGATAGGATAGGATAGGATAGGATAGGATAGGATAGGATAGGATAGGATAGGATAGGATAGGATAGGATAGGATAGGATAGGATAGGATAGGATAGGAAATQLAFTTSPQTLYAGQCSAAVTVETRSMGGTPVTVTVNHLVTLGPATASFDFYSDSSCATPITTVTIMSGQSNATFYFRGYTGGADTLTAAAGGLASAGQPVTIHPAARRGTCTIGNGDTSATCSIPAPALLALNRTVLIYQVAPPQGANGSGNALARCHLVNTSSLECVRGSNSGALVAHWQTFTWPTEATVQHISGIACTGNTTTVPISNVGSTSDVFVLHGLSMVNGNVNEDEHDVVTLASPTSVTLAHASGACVGLGQHDLQVVKLQAAIVNAGTAVLDGATSVTQGGLPACNESRSVVLYSWDATGTGGDVCERSLRGTRGISDVRFDRANGNNGSACRDNGATNIGFQRVEFPFGAVVQQVTLAMNDGAASVTNGINAVDPTRTLLFAGGVGHSPGAIGETNETGSDVVGNYVARFSLNGPGNQVTATRVDTTGNARFTVFVVELTPR